MTAIAFDTYKLIAKLQTHCFSEGQNALDAVTTVKTELETDMCEREYRLIIRRSSMLFIGFGFLAAITFFGS